MDTDEGDARSILNVLLRWRNCRCHRHKSISDSGSQLDRFMGRRSKNEDVTGMLFEILGFLFRVLPPWTSIPVAIAGFFLITVIWAMVIPVAPARPMGAVLGLGFATICLIAGWKGAEFRGRQRAFAHAHIDMDWVRSLSWRDFERQMAAVYRQQGYQVEEVGGGGPDGGVDLRLFKDGLTTVVQCKHWKVWKVGVKPIRELFGVMTAERADAAIFITSGVYTHESVRFAADKPLDLVDQQGFLELVRFFQRDLQMHYGVTPTPNQTAALKPVPTKSSPKCPSCQSPMILRTAKKGSNAGSQFWGCSRYPNCRGTLDYS